MASCDRWRDWYACDMTTNRSDVPEPNHDEPAMPADPVDAPVSSGASDLTLLILLAGVVILLVTCIAFILVAS